MACRPNTHRPSFHVNMVGLGKTTQRSKSSRFPWELDAEMMDEDEEEFELWLQEALASGLFCETSKRRKSWSPFKLGQKIGSKQWRRTSCQTPQDLGLSSIACLFPWRNVHVQSSHSQGMSEKRFTQTVGRMPRLNETTRHNVYNNIGFTGSGGRFNPKLRQIACVAFILTHPLRYLKHEIPCNFLAPIPSTPKSCPLC